MKKTRMEGDGGDGDGSSRVHGFCEVKEMGICFDWEGLTRVKIYVFIKT